MKCENPECDNIVTEIYKKTKKLKMYCSAKCRGKHNSLKSREKAKCTWIEKHGVEHPSYLEEVKLKTKQTNLERHGVEHPMQSEIFKEKAKQSMLRIHGVTHSMHSVVSIEKLKATNRIKHGTDYTIQSIAVREKAKRTCMARHGTEYALQSAEIREKAKQTCLERHGVENPFMLPTIQTKIRNTNMQRHGSICWANRHIPTEIKQLLNDPIWLKQQNETKSLEEISCELGINPHILSVRFKKFNISVKHHSKSFFEKQVIEYVKSIYSNIIPNDRQQIKPFELDIWFPDLNLAIECNGRYFHQDEQKEINKFNLCKEKGIDLHFIWDDEWNKDQENIKRHIYSLIFKK